MQVSACLLLHDLGLLLGFGSLLLHGPCRLSLLGFSPVLHIQQETECCLCGWSIRYILPAIVEGLWTIVGACLSVANCLNCSSEFVSVLCLFFGVVCASSISSLLLIFVGSDEITAHLLSGHLSILFKNVIMEKFLVLMKMLRGGTCRSTSGTCGCFVIF